MSHFAPYIWFNCSLLDDVEGLILISKREVLLWILDVIQSAMFPSLVLSK
jgi:hypothetical protein